MALDRKIYWNTTLYFVTFFSSQVTQIASCLEFIILDLELLRHLETLSKCCICYGHDQLVSLFVFSVFRLLYDMKIVSHHKSKKPEEEKN